MTPPPGGYSSCDFYIVSNQYSGSNMYRTLLLSDAIQLCLDANLQHFKVALQQNDAVLSDLEHAEFLPFIGEF